MAINYFEDLGFGANLREGMSNLANGLMYQQQKQEQQAQQAKKEQQAALQFANEQQKLRAAQGAGAFYNALQANNPQAALQIAKTYEQEINSLGDPAFTIANVEQMLQTPEGMNQLKQMAAGTVQLAAGPDKFAQYVQAQQRPETSAEATAQIKNTTEYRRYTKAIADAANAGDKELARQLKEERDFFVNQVDPYARSYASGQGAGMARVQTEQSLNPVLAAREAEKVTAQEGTATGKAELSKAQMEAQKAQQAQTDAEKVKAQQIDLSRQTAQLAKEIASSKNLDQVTGVGAMVPTINPESQDLILKAERLISLLTADNLKLMSGVLTDKDIQMLQTLSSGMRVTDKGILGSAPAIRKRLTEIADGIEKKLGVKAEDTESKTDSRDDAAILSEYGVN